MKDCPLERARLEQIAEFPQHNEHGDIQGWITLRAEDRDALVFMAMHWLAHRERREAMLNAGLLKNPLR